MSVMTGIEAAYYDLVNELEQYVNDLHRVAEVFNSETARSRAIIVQNILERNRV